MGENGGLTSILSHFSPFIFFSFVFTKWSMEVILGAQNLNLVRQYLSAYVFFHLNCIPVSNFRAIVQLFLALQRLGDTNVLP